MKRIVKRKGDQECSNRLPDIWATGGIVFAVGRTDPALRW